MKTKAKTKSKVSKAGPPVKYNPKFHLPLVKYMCKAGAIDVEIAAELGIVTSTLYEWKKKYSEFAEVMKVGKAVADAKVEQALFNRATGFEYDEVMEEENEKGFRERTTKKLLPGDVLAQIFWLKNRMPDKWRDKQEVQHSFDLKELQNKSDAELEAIIKGNSK